MKSFVQDVSLFSDRSYLRFNILGISCMSTFQVLNVRKYINIVLFFFFFFFIFYLNYCNIKSFVQDVYLFSDIIPF